MNEDRDEPVSAVDLILATARLRKKARSILKFNQEYLDTLTSRYARGLDYNDTRFDLADALSGSAGPDRDPFDIFGAIDCIEFHRGNSDPVLAHRVAVYLTILNLELRQSDLITSGMLAGAETVIDRAIRAAERELGRLRAKKRTNKPDPNSEGEAKRLSKRRARLAIAKEISANFPEASQLDKATRICKRLGVLHPTDREVRATLMFCRRELPGF